MKAAFERPGVRAHLREIYLPDLDRLLSPCICDQDDLRDYVESAPLVIDNRTRVDFTIPQSAIGRLHVFGRVRKETSDALYREVVTNLLAVCDLLDRTKPIYPRLSNVGPEAERVRENFERLYRLHVEMHREFREIVEAFVDGGGKRNMNKVAPALVGLRHKYLTGQQHLVDRAFR